MGSINYRSRFEQSDTLAEEKDYDSMKRFACTFLSDLAVTYAESFYHGSSEIVKNRKTYEQTLQRKDDLRRQRKSFPCKQIIFIRPFQTGNGQEFYGIPYPLRIREAKNC